MFDGLSPGSGEPAALANRHVSCVFRSVPGEPTGLANRYNYVLCISGLFLKKQLVWLTNNYVLCISPLFLENGSGLANRRASHV